MLAIAAKASSLPPASSEGRRGLQHCTSAGSACGCAISHPAVPCLLTPALSCGIRHAQSLHSLKVAASPRTIDSLLIPCLASLGHRKEMQGEIFLCSLGQRHIRTQLYHLPQCKHELCALSLVAPPGVIQLCESLECPWEEAERAEGGESFRLLYLFSKVCRLGNEGGVRSVSFCFAPKSCGGWVEPMSSDLA